MGPPSGVPGRGAPLTSAEPARPAAPRTREVQASVLAALQLVEDARYRGSDRRRHSERVRQMAERTVVSRKLARDMRAG
jgi:hypothetical protein